MVLYSCLNRSRNASGAWIASLQVPENDPVKLKRRFS